MMHSRKILLVLCLFLSMAAWGQNAPNFTVTYPFRFIAYGDIRFTDPAARDWSDPDYRRAIIQQVAQEKPSFLVITGDLVRKGSVAADWQVWDQETQPWRNAGIRILPVLGNHDTWGDPQALEYFSRFPILKKLRWYTVRAGNCYFIMLESENNAPGTEQWMWLEKRLRKLPGGVRYLFIVQHHPPVTRSSERIRTGGHSARPVDTQLAALLEDRQKVLKVPIIVLAGHVHNYERYDRGGVTYITAGGGGATPYEIPREPQDAYQGSGATYSYCRFTVDRNSLKLETIRVELAAGQPSFTLVDSFQFGQPAAKAATASR